MRFGLRSVGSSGDGEITSKCSYCPRQERPRTHGAAQPRMRDWKIDPGLLQERSLTVSCPGREDTTLLKGPRKYQQLTKSRFPVEETKQLRFMCIYLFFQGRLLLHPVWLLWLVRRLIAHIPSHNSCAFNRLFFHPELCKKPARKKVHVAP